MKYIGFASVLLVLLTGCGDRMTTYLQGRGDSTRVQANQSMLKQGQCEKTMLRADWLEGHLLGLMVESSNQPLYDPEKLSPAMPGIQMALAEWGNVRIKRAFTENVTLWLEHWISGGKIGGQFAGVYISGDIPPVGIPTEAYPDR